MTNNTIFDDVFRTMLEKMTYLIVPLINEVFHTSYPEDIEIAQLRNENQLETGKLITDARLLIGGKVYHIECQSTDDVTMAIRMLEYDFAIAMEQGWREHRKYHLEFPKSCVIYLRCTENTPDFLEVEMVLPDGQICQYKVPTIKLKNYTKENIFEKKLLLLLPFYVMKFERKLNILEEDYQILNELLKEYEDIRKKLEEEISVSGKSELYTDLNKLIIRVSDYIFRDKEKIRKGVHEIMGGKVLQLESERLREEGKASGEIIGEERMRALINHLISDGRTDEIQNVINNVEICRKFYEKYGL